MVPRGAVEQELTFRDFYVWRADPPPDTSDQVVFPDQETGIWELDERAGEYYLHRFYKHQPDLNVANPAVRDEIAKVMGFWLELGISGFRVDAVPFLLETTGATEQEKEQFADPHDYLRALRSFLGRRTGDGILLGEVNLPYPDQKKFFGGSDGDELTMLFDFIGMQNLYLSLARADARPLARSAEATTRRSTTMPVGDVPAQPRRAHARQAQRQRAPGGLRRLRPRAERMQAFGRGLDGAYRPCSTATPGGSGWPTA